MQLDRVTYVSGGLFHLPPQVATQLIRAAGEPLPQPGALGGARPQLSTNSTVPPWRQRLMHPLLTHRWYQSGLPAYRLLRVRHRAPRVINGANRGCCTAGSCTVG